MHGALELEGACLCGTERGNEQRKLEPGADRATRGPPSDLLSPELYHKPHTKCSKHGRATRDISESSLRKDQGGNGLVLLRDPVSWEPASR